MSGPSYSSFKIYQQKSGDSGAETEWDQERLGPEDPVPSWDEAIARK